MMTEKKDYSDDDLTAWLNGEFKAGSARELERSMSLDNDLRDRVSSLASDISAVRAEGERRKTAEIPPQKSHRTLIAISAIAAICVVSIAFLLT